MSLKTDEMIIGEFFRFKITGRLYVLELMHAIRELWDGTYQLTDRVNELWDLTEAEFSHLSFQAAEEFSNEILRYTDSDKPGKVAFLLPDNADKYLATYLTGLLENNINREFKIFHHQQEAYQFLGYKKAEV